MRLIGREIREIKKLKGRHHPKILRILLKYLSLYASKKAESNIGYVQP